MKQLRKNVLLLVSLAVAAGVLGLYAFFGVVKRDEQRLKDDKVAAKFVAAEPSGGGAAAEYVRVAITLPSGSTTLEKQAAGWRVVLPVNAPADPSVMEAVTGQLDRLELTAMVDDHPTPDALMKYGLEVPAFEVAATVRPKDGGEDRTFTLKGGAENSFDGLIYAQRNGDAKVYSLPGGARFDLMKTTFELREKRVLRVPSKDVKRIEVKTPAREMVLERTAKVWKLLKPEATGADVQAVQQFLSALSNEHATSFAIDSSDERTKDGLDAPLLSATFTLEKGDAIRLDVGRPAGDAGASLWVLRNEGHETELAEVTANALRLLDKDPATLRDRAVISFEKDKVAKLEFFRGPVHLVVERDLSDGGSVENWRVTEPAQGPAKKFKLTSILWTLGSLKAKELLDENPKSWAKWGLEKPEQEVKLYDGTGALLADLRVGSDVEGKEHTKYARGTRDRVVEMPAERLVDLPASVSDVLEPGPGAPAFDAGR